MILKSSHQKRQDLLQSRKTVLPINRLKSTSTLDTSSVPAGFGAVRLDDFPTGQPVSLEVFFPSGIHLAVKGDANMKEIFELINGGR